MAVWLNFIRSFIALCFAAAVTACGLYTPDKDPFTSNAPAGAYPISRQGSYESRLIDHVTCEIAKALSEADQRWGTKIPWLKDRWGIAVTLSMTMEDQSGLSPGITATTPLRNAVFPFTASNGGNVTLAQSFSYSVGGTASVNALRTEMIQFTIENKVAIAHPDCNNIGSGILIDGDLKIREFIFDKAQIVVEAPGLWDDNGAVPYNAWSEEITFVAAYGASATPTWHLARVSANTSSNLFVTQRTNTNDLVLTLGPMKCPAPQKPATPIVEFSDLLKGIGDGKVGSLQLEDNPIRGKVNAGKLLQGKVKVGHVYQNVKVDNAFQTFVPDNAFQSEPNKPTLMQSLYTLALKNRVSIGSSMQQTAPECTKDDPVALVDAAMNQHNARVAANAIAVSVTGQAH
jgi:hypothetical protein